MRFAKLKEVGDLVYALARDRFYIPAEQLKYKRRLRILPTCTSYTHMCTHTHIHTYLHTHTHTHTHTRAHAHSQCLSEWCSTC